jgi:hypothetical protein
MVTFREVWHFQTENRSSMVKEIRAAISTSVNG